MKVILNLLLGIDRLRDVLSLLAGLVLAAAVMLAAGYIADECGIALLRVQGIDPAGKHSPLSPVPVAIVLGLLIRNVIGHLSTCDPGLKFATSKLLRLGIILFGLKLSVQELLRAGVWIFPAVAVVIASGLIFVMLFNRLLGLPPKLGTLIAAGTSICGVTAIVCTAPTIRAAQREVAYAVANITLFGLIAMLAYPYLAPLMLHNSGSLGMFFGTAIHDTSQVIGAALTYSGRTGDEAAQKIAIFTKLTRNIFLAIVVPLLTYLTLRREGGADGANGGGATRVPLSKLLPAFVLGFLLMAVVRSLGDAGPASGGAALGLFNESSWKAAISQLADTWGARYCLATAMAAVGLSTSFSVFRGVGVRPFIVGFVAAVLVGGVALTMAILVGPYVSLQ